MQAAWLCIDHFQISTACLAVQVPVHLQQHRLPNAHCIITQYGQQAAAYLMLMSVPDLAMGFNKSGADRYFTNVYRQHLLPAAEQQIILFFWPLRLASCFLPQDGRQTDALLIPSQLCCCQWPVSQAATACRPRCSRQDGLLLFWT